MLVQLPSPWNKKHFQVMNVGVVTSPTEFFVHKKKIEKHGSFQDNNLVKTWWPWGAGMFATSLGPHDACSLASNLGWYPPGKLTNG